MTGRRDSTKGKRSTDRETESRAGKYADIHTYRRTAKERDGGGDDRERQRQTETDRDRGRQLER